MGFATRLRELRHTAGLTQEELAEKVGLSKSGLAYLEQGLREPGWRTVLKLAKTLGVDCRAFGDCEDESSTEDEPKQGRGRPPKPKPEDQAEGEKPKKRPRGRPRKQE